MGFSAILARRTLRSLGDLSRITMGQLTTETSIPHPGIPSSKQPTTSKHPQRPSNVSGGSSILGATDGCDGGSGIATCWSFPTTGKGSSVWKSREDPQIEMKAWTLFSGWWFQIFVMFSSRKFWKTLILTKIFQMGWNTQVVFGWLHMCGFLFLPREWGNVLPSET